VGELSLADVCAEGQRLLGESDPDPLELAAFAVAVRAVAEGAPADALERLAEVFASVRAHGRTSHDALKRQISQAGQGRRALRGYGGLRTAGRRCQRASTWS